MQALNLLNIKEVIWGQSVGDFYKTINTHIMIFTFTDNSIYYFPNKSVIHKKFLSLTGEYNQYIFRKE